MADKTINHLQIQNIPVNNIALSTLGARAALLLASTFSTSIKNSFLVKKVKMMLHLTGATTGAASAILVALGSGDITVTEFAAALTEINTVGPEDTTQIRTSDNVWNIWQKTLSMFADSSDPTVAVIDKEYSLGKGMVARSEQGILAMAFNNDGSALDTGIVVNGLIQLWGVWLRD